jgi:hypothetical protein
VLIHFFESESKQTHDTKCANSLGSFAYFFFFILYEMIRGAMDDERWQKFKGRLKDAYAKYEKII